MVLVVNALDSCAGVVSLDWKGGGPSLSKGAIGLLLRVLVLGLI